MTSILMENLYSILNRMVESMDKSMVAKVVLGLLLVLVLAWLFPRGLTETYEYPEGSIWNEEDLISPMIVPIYRDPVLVAQEQDSARAATPLSYERIDSIPGIVRESALRILSQLTRLSDTLLASLSRNPADEEIQIKAVELRHRGEAAGLTFFTPDEWQSFLRQEIPRKKSPAGGKILIHTPVLKVLDALYAKGLLDQLKSSFQQDRLALKIGEVEQLLPVKSFFDANDLPVLVQHQLSTEKNTEMETLVGSIVMHVAKPDLMFHATRTQIAINAAIDKVPRTIGIIKENERIVSRHERITADIKMKLDSYQRARIENAGDADALLQFLGKIGHTIAILFLLTIYLFLFRKKIFHSNSRLILIATLLLFPALMAHLSLNLPIPGSIQYLVLVPVSAMLLVIIFDSRVAFYSTVTISFLVGAIRGNDYSMILASVLAGALALYTVRDIKHRTQIFRSLAFIFLGYSFAIAVDGLQRSIPTGDVAVSLAYAFINSILSPVITFGLLIFFERVFGFATDLTLLELSDFNQPLLRKLSTQAPGTFHHSVVMGSLAEAATMAIGANPILARVGAYYHDIGKTQAPEYFVENQTPHQNIHDTLPPQESARVIIAHVTDGIQLARENNIPERIIEFIPTHHGTNLVEYFYRKALKEQTQPVHEEDYRYPGPKPSSKETGIVMLADTIEAAARAMEEPTRDKIESLIEGIVTKRLSDGELENCDLTFRELTTVKKSFLTILTGIHHSRIKYPTQEEAEAARKLAERTSKLLNLPTAVESLTQRIKKLDTM